MKRENQHQNRLRRIAATGAFFLTFGALPAAPTQLYSHGDPSADEQFMLELINRARAVPLVEGNRLARQVETDPDVARAFFVYANAPYNENWVTRDRVRSDFAGIAAKPPLAFNSRLMTGARAQSNDQAQRNYQGHLFPPTNDATANQNAVLNRMLGVGYDPHLFDENVYASQTISGTYAPIPSVSYGHAGLMVDWAQFSDQFLFHRMALMSLYSGGLSEFKEMGIGAVRVPASVAGNVVAYALTQDFGVLKGEDNTIYLVGVAYSDRDRDYFYSVGEGEAGIRVTPDLGVYYAVSSTSGGYAIPLKGLPPLATSVNVTFSGGALGSKTITRTVNLNGTSNLKQDLRVPQPGDSAVVNLATRLRIETGDNVGIAGFVVTGTTAKRVLIRALGPSLAAQGVAGVLSNPRFTLVNLQGEAVASNDDWGSSQKADILATGLAPTMDQESALLATLAPGPYTAVVDGVGGATGVALIEVYDLDTTALNAKTANVATRGRVQTGDNVMIGGFVIQGTNPHRVVVRAIGPALTARGVTGALEDPTLTIVKDGAVVVVNDNWKQIPQADQDTLLALGLAPTDERECAVVLTLAPGPCTAIVSGVGGKTGVALVEVYDAE